MEMPLLHTGYIRKDIFHHILHMVHPDNIIDIIIIHHDTGIFSSAVTFFEFPPELHPREQQQYRFYGWQYRLRSCCSLKDIVKHLLHVFINRIGCCRLRPPSDGFPPPSHLFLFLYAIPPNQHQRNDVEQTGKYQTYISLQGHPPLKIFKIHITF